MIRSALPAPDLMYDALLRRDPSYDGVFFTAVRTTGIFCRPTCSARTPLRRNVDFYASAREALLAGYRPCKRCHPMENSGEPPTWLRPLLAELEGDQGRRWTDQDLRARGLDPARVRRWFKQHHDVTFHAYHRSRRVGRALSVLVEGGAVTDAAFDNGFESLSAFYDVFRRVVDSTPARARATVTVGFTRLTTPLGPMVAAATDSALCLLEFVDRRGLERELAQLGRELGGPVIPGRSPLLDQTTRELEEYFAGRRTQFEIPLRTGGSDFQRRVWQALTRIPYGETRSYGDMAAELGRPGAARALGHANGLNRASIVVPCHRVIGADGALTGYGGGLWRKQWLLDHERRHAGASASGEGLRIT
jgi:AraC family transcriptional regulator of adaptative response/methylated-DNA-[protein]-cysteine methyltransferase